MQGRRIRRSTLVLVLFGLAPAGLTAQQATTKMAYINTRAVLQVTPGYAQAESTFTGERDAARQEVDRLQSTLDSARTDFEQKSVMLSASARTARRRELDDQESRAQQRLSDLQDRLAQRERELLQPIQSRVNDVIEGIRAEGGYGIIFDVGANNGLIVAADKSLDLTQKVIDKIKSRP
jgi:outer membrane protein